LSNSTKDGTKFVQQNVKTTVGKFWRPADLALPLMNLLLPLCAPKKSPLAHQSHFVAHAPSWPGFFAVLRTINTRRAAVAISTAAHFFFRVFVQTCEMQPNNSNHHQQLQPFSNSGSISAHSVSKYLEN